MHITIQITKIKSNFTSKTSRQELSENFNIIAA